MRNKVIVGKMLDYCSCIIKRSSTIDTDGQRLSTDMEIFKLFAFDLMQLGELASKLDESFRNECTHIPWSQIRGLRNRIVHGYGDINTDIVWETIVASIPDLCGQLTELYESINGR